MPRISAAISGQAGRTLGQLLGFHGDFADRQLQLAFQHVGQAVHFALYALHLAALLVGGKGDIHVEERGAQHHLDVRRQGRFCVVLAHQHIDQRFQHQAVAGDVPARLQADAGVGGADAGGADEIRIIESAVEQLLPMLRLADPQPGHALGAAEQGSKRRHLAEKAVEPVGDLRQRAFDHMLQRAQAAARRRVYAQRAQAHFDVVRILRHGGQRRGGIVQGHEEPRSDAPRGGARGMHGMEWSMKRCRLGGGIREGQGSALDPLGPEAPDPRSLGGMAKPENPCAGFAGER
ncbi:MAG: hypothetical protein WDN04_22275 [Rhodospirillales bacterium]